MEYKRYNRNIYYLVEDGMAATDYVGEGRMIPGVVLKSEEGNSDLEQLIENHKGIEGGDVKLRWGKPGLLTKGSSKLLLHLEFSQPTKLIMQILFNTKIEYPVIDAIIQSRGLHFSTGEKGDRFSQKIGSGDTCTIEVPDLNFDNEWNKILTAVLKKKYRKQGVPRKQIKKSVEEHIKQLRRLTTYKKKSR